MATIGTISLAKGDILTTAHVYSQNRANDGYGIISGCDVHQKTVPGMGVTIDAGVVMYDGTYTTVAGGDVVIDAADATNPRFDIIYVNAVGTCLVAKGTAAAILPTGETAFKKMTTPYPAASIPAGIILARVYVAATVTTILNAAIDDIAMVITQVPLNILTTRGDLPYRNANTWARLAKSATSGHSLMQGADEPYWGYPDHTAIQNIGTNAHSVIDSFIASKAQPSGLASLDGSSVCVQEPKLHAARHASGGVDTIKLDDLATTDDNTDLNASTSKHGLMMKYPNTQQRLKGTGAWADPIFGVNFPFGNGAAVLTAEAQGKRIPVACKITKAYLRSTKGVDGDLLSGSITVTIYIHDYNVDADSVAASDTFSLSSASSYAETGLSIAVAAGKYITAIISGIATCKCVTLDLELEAT